MRPLLKKISIGLVVLSLAVSLTLVMGFNRWLNSPIPNLEQYQNYYVESGSSLARVANELHRRKQVKYPRLLVLYARFTGQDRIKAGEYQWADNISLKALLQQLNRGDVLSYQVTLVEGWTYAQALDHLHKQAKIQAQLKGLAWQEQQELLSLNLDNPEGWFFPDTYQYVANTTDVDILRRAYTAMDQALQSEWQQRAEGLPYKDAYQALIMASIVERETGVADERGTIAGVFVRRLQKRMRLQTDPTVIYGLGQEFNGNLTRRHLRQATPYNTYVIHGLPPTPIALPGRAAIKAALNPEAGSALYFVAKGDGSHHFSDTLEEHNKAVQNYQVRKRRSDYRSRPK